MTHGPPAHPCPCLAAQECETKIAQEIASLSKEDVSKEETNENEEVINILLAQVSHILFSFTSLLTI